MRIVIALGGNALLRRSDPMTTEVQRKNIEIAARAIAPLADAAARFRPLSGPAVLPRLARARFGR